MGTIDKIIKEIQGSDNTSKSFRKNKKREKLFSELREEILKLKEFEIWKEWKNR
jgi:HKD family nuclease